MLQFGRMPVLIIVVLSSSLVVSARDLRQRRAESADPMLTSDLASVCLSGLYHLPPSLTSIFGMSRQSHPPRHDSIPCCREITLQPQYVYACRSAPGHRPVLTTRAKNTAVEFHQEAESPHDKIPRPEMTRRYSTWLILIHSFSLSSGFATLLALVKRNILARHAHAD